ncbi:phage holin family protein [Cryptosporangium arvum]|uniref:phage holin family protein n=1 Tax=Cryptosporangium arvum TaxID=80871 RepID=UPI0007C56757|nr:phage holin family protein [Cryptosporangium arvum]
MTSDTSTRSNSGSTPRPAVERAREPSIGQLVNDVAAGVSSLVKAEIALAKAEVAQEAKKAVAGVAGLAVAAAAGLMIVPLLSLAAVYALREVMAGYWAALIVAGVWALIAGIAGLFGALRLRRVKPVPTQAIEAVKEDVRWVRDRKI